MDYQLEIIDIKTIIEVDQSSTDSYNIFVTQPPIVEVTEIAEKGSTGSSAYEIAVNNGFVGTEAQWLNSLNGHTPTNAELLALIQPLSQGLTIPVSESVIISDLSTLTFTLSEMPEGDFFQVFLNGIREKKSSFVVLGNQIDISLLNLGIGDELTFDYRHSL